MPLLLVPQFELYHLKTIQKEESHGNEESGTVCCSFYGRRSQSLRGGDTHG